MERDPLAHTGDPVAADAWPRMAGLVALLGLTVWQGWMTLTLFGPDRPWQRLLDDQPIVAGRHPLHLYHGYLGAHSFHERGTLCCFDPNFQAGYPKTPVFDSGSRPAELFLILAGGAYRPAAYKVGLAVFCTLVPLLLLLAARGAGLGYGPACLAVALGLLVWWGVPCQALLTAGDLDLLLAALAAVAQAGLLVRFDRVPGAGGWLGLLLTGGLGWFAQPSLFALLLPFFLVYYFRVGGRHGLLWHLALFAGLAGAVAGNAFWLGDWVGHWWIRAPLAFDAGPLPRHTLWDASLWGGVADRFLAVVLIVLAAVGVWHLNHLHRRQAARFFGLGTATFLFLALGGAAWEPLGRLGTQRLLASALFFAAVPAAHALVVAVRALCHWSGAIWRGALLAASLLSAAGLIASEYVNTIAARCAGGRPLEIGLGPEREALAAALREHTTSEARILWEDRPLDDGAAHWTPLLPLLTGRAYLGGLDSCLPIEHAHAGFRDQMLAGRLIGDWSDAELDDYCRRYNVGWVVCWSRAAEERLRAWKAARLVTVLDADGPRRLFAIERTASYALKGSRARWLHADSAHIALADVEPNENGEAVLSLHYQAGMRVSPSRVQLERELDPYDPIPFVRLRLPGPVVRVTITWEKK